MKKYIIYLLVSLSFTNSFYPEDNAELNYIQIFFKWPQIEDAVNYILTITPDIGVPIMINSESNSVINNEYLNWDTQYSWEVCGYNEINEILYCYDEIGLVINPLPSFYPNEINVLQLLENDYYDGITILDFDSMRFSSAVDKNGTPIWFADRTQFGNPNNKILVTQFLNSGNFLGTGFGKGYEFDINSNIIFETPSQYSTHHDFIRNENTYFIINGIEELHPCPDNCPENLPENIYWLGDRFIQLDIEGNLIWDWNAFDYIDLNEYNPLYLDRLSNSYPEDQSMDWTHSNSIYFSNENIYLSLRNLSRIIKVDYNTKDIKWHIGNTEFMNETYFNNDLEFSQQHSVKKIDNGNILFFDNHTGLEPEISRCIEFAYDEELNTANVVWEYILPDSLFTGSRGQCNRLANGNTLINVGRTGNIYEINNNNEIVWHLRMKNDDIDVSSFRTQRVKNLYPLAFSMEINNLKGEYTDYVLQYDSLFTFMIYNQGWSTQDYNYYIINGQGDTLYYSSTIVAENSFVIKEIDIELLDFSYQENYTLTVQPLDNFDETQSVTFNYIGLFGDINNDQNIDIIDIVYLINLILESNYNFIADLNNDEELDVLDIVILVNLIIR